MSSSDAGEQEQAPDPVMTALGDALARARAGRREEARAALTALWEAVGPAGDPLPRCAVAHHLADLQDDPREELAWDLRALTAAESLTDEHAAAAGATGPAAAFYPSLHLNLGEDHRRLGDPAAARRHLELGRAAAIHLPDDGYGAMVARGLDALAERLAGDQVCPRGGAGAAPPGRSP